MVIVERQILVVITFESASDSPASLGESHKVWYTISTHLIAITKQYP